MTTNGQMMNGSGKKGSAVHMLPLAPQESLSKDQVTQIENGGEFLLDGRMADIKLSFGWKAPGIDVDASLAMYDASGKVVDVIWWDKMTSRFCSVKHVNDDQTGKNEGDNEIIEVDIQEMPYTVHYIVPVVTVYSKQKYLKDVGNISMKILDTVTAGKGKSDIEVAEYKPKVEHNVDNESALILGVFTRKGAWWHFNALGMSGRGRTIKEIVATTPLNSIVKPASTDAKPRRVYLWAVEAKEVAAADFPMFGEKSSDCFVEIICKGRRSLSDVVENSLNPKWDMPKVFLGEATESDYTTVEINVWDHDTNSEDDFLGTVALSLGGLIQQGVGVHDITLPLGQPLNNEITLKKGVEIKGDLVLKCEIIDPTA